MLRMVSTGCIFLANPTHTLSLSSPPPRASSTLSSLHRLSVAALGNNTVSSRTDAKTRSHPLPFSPSLPSQIAPTRRPVLSRAPDRYTSTDSEPIWILCVSARKGVFFACVCPSFRYRILLYGKANTHQGSLGLKGEFVCGHDDATMGSPYGDGSFAY